MMIMLCTVLAICTVLCSCALPCRATYDPVVQYAMMVLLAVAPAVTLHW